MKDRPVLVAIVLLLLVLGAFATPAISAAVPEIGCKNKNYFAKDSVDEPGVDRAHFKYEDVKGEPDYYLDLHTLKVSKDEEFLSGSVRIYPEPGIEVLILESDNHTYYAEDLKGPLSGLSLSYLRLLMDYRLTYLNLETTEGEINAPIFVNGKCNLPDSLITGLVFYDSNGNGAVDPGEAGIAGIPIEVRDGTDYDVDSGSDGTFTILVNPGSYTISMIVPPGYVNTTPASVSKFILPGNGTFILFGLNWTGPAPNPAIDIEKSTNGYDADTAPGPEIPVGEAVEWEYVVTNTGNVELENINISDDQLGEICTISSLATGESKTCTAYGVAVAGLYANVGNVTAEYDGMSVSDEDMSHYFGTAEGAAIDIEKSTNGFDADVAPGPSITVGSSVTWTYNVTNIGTVTLSDINITDDQLGDVCTISSLATGESKNCTMTGTAEPGPYSNIGTATVEYDSTIYTDTDPSHYYGESGPSTATIRVWKHDLEENPVNGWKFTVDGETKPTEPDGHVDFEVSSPGTYTITEEIKPSWVNVSPTSQEVAVSSGVHEVYFVNFEGAKVTVCKLDQFDNPVEDWHVFVDEIEQITGEDGCTVFYIEKPDTYTITEESRAGWIAIGATSYEVKVKPGEEYGPFNFTNRFEGVVLVNAEKFVSADGEDWYQSLPIPYDDDVYWKIVIENRGTVPVDITVNDTLNGTKITPSCSPGSIPTSLDAGENETCIIGPQSADAGTIWNEVEVKGCNDGVCDTDTASAFYEGTIDADINVEKYVSEDGSEWFPSIAVPAETPVYWKIFIENSGTHTLGLTVEDYLDGSSFSLPCTFDPLAPGENVSCTTDSTPALPGIHENYVEVMGCYDEICGTGNATAEYEGTVTADLVVEKYVSVDKENWYSSLKQVPAGTDIAWKIFIENTGTHTLDIEVEDYLDGSLFDTGCTFPENLTPGENTTCIFDDTAEEGSHENYVNVTGCYGDICESSDSRATYSSPITPPPDVGVDVEKYVSTDRANWRSYISSVLVDTPMWWQFTIYNTGSDDIDTLSYYDADLNSDSCEEGALPDNLSAGESFTCTFKDPEYAMEHRQDNYLYVYACNGSTCDDDSDEAWYIGKITADIIVKKYVSRDNKTWSDYSIDVPVGSDVYWKIVIENKGTHPLNLTAEDYLDGRKLELTCIPEILKAGEKTSCVIGPYTAERWYITNKIDVTGCYESRSSGEFCDLDDDYADYRGEISADIKVTKYVSGDRVIWYHRFEPQLLVGSDVYWKIVIENTGEAPLDLEITDKLDGDEYTPICNEGSLPTSLGAGESAYCIWNDTTEEGYHWNTVDVQGCFGKYCEWHDHDIADYMGVYEPKAILNKDVSSDNVTWDNYIELPFMDTVYWRIEIENTAQHPIDITLTDTYKGETFTPPCLEGTLPSTLGVGEDAVCTFTAIAEPPDEIISNRAFLDICYHGFCDYLESTAEYKAYINAELAVNKQVSLDNETWSDEVDVPVGSDVFWKIEVENTGTHTLNLTFTHTFDGQPATTDCTWGDIPSTLNPKEKATCIIKGTADYDTHENYAWIQGCDQIYESICDEDDARAEYTGIINPELKVTKLVSPNGTDWFGMPITVPIGSDIYWRINIENTGTHTLELDVNDTLDGDPFTLECANFTEPLAPGNKTTCIIGPDPAATGSHVNSVRVDGCFEGDHPYCDTQVASSSYFGSEAPQKAAIDVEKYVLVNRSGEWIRYNGEDATIPVLLKDEAFRWEIWVENNGTVPLELYWTDSYNGTPLDLNATCENLPTSLAPEEIYSCLIDDVAKADDTTDGSISYNSTWFTNVVRVEGEYEDLKAEDEDSATYLGVESLFGVKKFIKTKDAGIYDANEPPVPDIIVGDEFFWGFVVWNMQNEAADLTWEDDYNGNLTGLDTGSFPGLLDALDDDGFIIKDTAIPGLFYNNVTVSFNYSSIDDEVDSDIAYYTGYYPSPYAIVKGFVLNDTDADGIWNKSEETGLAGANVTISNGTWSASVTTGPDGNFTLHVPAVGDYVITETNPIGYISTNAIPGDGATKWDNDNLNISIDAFTVYDDHLFGDVLQGSVAVLAGRVFDDENETGTWDAGEKGLPGVNVTMEIQDNPMPFTVKTNATGEYQFAVLPGTNVRISSEGPGGDYFPTTLESLYLTPPSAGLYTGNDFGYSDDEVAVIFGIVFNDINSNGEQGLGESGLPGANVTLDGITNVTTTCIDLNCGRFTFVTEDTGIHSVHEENPSGYRSTTPDDVNVDVDELGESYPVNFGDTNRTDIASIYGTVFDDCNGNGVQDTDEQGIEGVRVNLTDASGMEILNTTTKEYGHYTFGISDPGVYNVVEQDPAKEGYRSTTPDRVPVLVALNESYMVNFGDTDCTGFSTIMGTVFEDSNRDGTFNWSELGIKDVTVNLSSGDSTSTDRYGSYSFKVVTPGQVNVTETDPAGYESTTPNVVPVDVTLNEPYTVNFGDAKETFATITACKKDNPGNNLSGWQMNVWREEDQYYQKNWTTGETGCTVFTVEIGSIYKLFESQKEGWRAIEPEDGTVEPVHHAHYEVNVTEPGDYRYTFVNEEVLEPNVYVYACKNDTSGTPLIGWAMMLSVDGGGPVYQSGMTDDTGCTVFTLEYAETQITAQLEEVRKPGWENVTDWKYGFTINEPGTHTYTFVNRREGEEMSTIKAIAYRDNNRNGVQDKGESYLAGVTFTLRLDDDQIGQKITDSSGTVSFTDLEPDTYRLSAAPPSSRWYLTSGSSARDVTVAEDETALEKFGYRYRGGPGPGPTPKPTPPEVGAAPECDFYENGTLTINEDGLNLETIVICALDGIGKLIVYEDVTALNPLGEPLEWATIVVIPGAPDAGEQYTFMGTAYNCSPNKATFDSPITLLMEYGEYQWAELSGKNLVIMRWDAETGEWTKLPTTINENERAVFADVTELGIFALFVEGPPVVESPPVTPVTIIVLQYYWWIIAVILLGTISFITLMAHRENEKAL